MPATLTCNLTPFGAGLCAALHRRPCRRRCRGRGPVGRADKSEDLVLIVDVGTNAEILLGQQTKVLACSSPTGPAFEGAQISSGQRAAPGAIERVEIDPVTKEPRFKVIGSDLWSDEPGFDAATATTGITGICGSGIIEAVAEMRLAGIVDRPGPDRRARTDRVGSAASRTGGPIPIWCMTAAPKVGRS
jgi:uncharacterized 2Fe-2S/4Fe-4S cluster protein (DUF4445 family)